MFMRDTKFFRINIQLFQTRFKFKSTLLTSTIKEIKQYAQTACTTELTFNNSEEIFHRSWVSAVLHCASDQLGLRAFYSITNSICWCLVTTILANIFLCNIKMSRVVHIKRDRHPWQELRHVPARTWTLESTCCNLETWADGRNRGRGVTLTCSKSTLKPFPPPLPPPDLCRHFLTRLSWKMCALWYDDRPASLLFIVSYFATSRIFEAQTDSERTIR